MKALATVALLVLAPAGAAAQAARAGAPVRLEFRALSPDGQPVADLKPADVTLKVNGKARTIQSLSLFHASAEAAAGSSPLPPPYASNVVSSHGRVLHVLIDDDSISPGREGQIRDAMRMLGAELSPADRLGLLTTQGTINIAPTTDLTKVKVAADGLAGRAASVETDADAQCRTKRMLAAVGTMISLTGGTPTTIVIFSSGISTPAVKQVRIGTATGTSEVCPVEPDDFANVGSLASIANADLYLFHVTEGRAAHSSTQDAGFESLAGVTGAEFVRLTASPQPAIARLLRETAAYYVATFDPEPGERNGQISRVELKTSRDNVKLRARPSVQMPKEIAARAGASPKDMLRVATVFHDLPLRAAAHASRLPGGKDVRVVALFEGIDPNAPLTAASVGLFDEQNKLKAQWTAQKDDLAARPVRADLQAPPGLYRVRVAAIDASGRAGTTDFELRAEIAHADPLALSTLVVGTQQEGAGFAPRLEFAGDHVAIGLLEIYNVPKTGNLAVTLDVASTPDGPPLASAETQIGRGAGDDARTAAGGFAIDGLPAGDYLMRAVVLLDGKPVGRVTRTLRKAR